MDGECEEILQAISHPILILDPQHRILAANRAALKVTDMREAEFLGKKCYEIFHNSGNPPAGCPIEKMLMSRQPETFEMEMEALGGTFLVSCTPFFDAQGHLEKIFHIATDITKLKHAQEALHESVQQFALFMDYFPGAVLMKDEESRVLYVNQYVKDHFNAENWLGCSPFEILAKEKAETMRADDLRALRNGPIVGTETHKDNQGSLHIYQTYKFPVKRKDGGIWLGIIALDVTDRIRAEGLVRENELRLNCMLQSITDHMSMMDPELNIIWANETTKKTFGDSIIGKKCYEVYHKLKTPCEPYPCLTLRAFMDGKIHEHETQVSDLNGKTRYFHCSANVALEDQDGNPTAVLEISRDISERKWAEEALRQSEEKYRRLIETTDTGYVIIDSTGHVLDANLKYIAMSGHQTLDEILGRTVTEWTSESDMERNIAAVKQCLEQGYIRNLEIHYVDKTGKITPVEINATVVQDDTGLKIMTLCRDIRVRKRNEEELRESEERYRTLVEDMPAMICRFSPDGILTFVNTMYGKFFRKSPEELVGENFFQFIPEEEQKGVRSHFLSLNQGKPIVTYDHQVFAPDGTVRWMQWTDRALIDKKGNVGQYQSLGMDITARRQAEEILARHRDHLEELVRERTHALEAAQEELLRRERLSVLGQITATVSHELRNPLGVIRSSVFYLQQRCSVVDEKVLKHLERIEEQVGVCDSIVADLLEYTRGRHSEKVVGDLSALLRRVLEENPPPPGVTIDRNFSDEPLLVPFDPIKLSRAMVNLLENAYQAIIDRIRVLKGRDTPYHASVRVCIMHGDGEAVIEVEDNGIGMDEETAQRAFEPLFTRRARGIGLGLAIVQKVIKEHGGRVFLTSRQNLGTKVTLILPADYGGHIG